MSRVVSINSSTFSVTADSSVGKFSPLTNVGTNAEMCERVRVFSICRSVASLTYRYHTSLDVYELAGFPYDSSMHAFGIEPEMSLFDSRHWSSQRNAMWMKSLSAISTCFPPTSLASHGLGNCDVE